MVKEDNTQDGNFSKDRLGVNKMKGAENVSESPKSTYKNNSPLALEARTAYLQNKDMLKNIPITRKQMVFEQESTLLDENNLKE